MDQDAERKSQLEAAQKAELMASWQNQSQQRQARDAAFKRSEESLKRNSGMRFDGEDRFAPERHRMQELQNRRWLAQQRADNDRKNEKARLAAEKEERLFQERLRLMKEMDERNADNSYQLRKEMQKYNQEAAKQKTLENQSKSKSDNRSKARANQEVLNFWDNDRLATVGETSCLGGHRVRTDHWRGMNPAQRKAIYAENQRVLAEGKAKRAQEEKERIAYQRQLREQTRILELSEYEAEEKRKSVAKQQLASHLQQDREATDARAREKRDRGNVKVSSEFFASFGTTAR